MASTKSVDSARRQSSGVLNDMPARRRWVVIASAREASTLCCSGRFDHSLEHCARKNGGAIEETDLSCHEKCLVVRVARDLAARIWSRKRKRMTQMCSYIISILMSVTAKHWGHHHPLSLSLDHRCTALAQKPNTVQKSIFSRSACGLWRSEFGDRRL